MMDGMFMKITVAITLLLVLIEFPSPTTGLKCYQCDSTLDSNCQEKWDDSLQVNENKYKSCNLWDAKYCIKVTGMWGGVVGTHRFCSSRDMGDQCQDIWFPDHDRMYRACVFTCDDDGCNGSSRSSLHFFLTFIILALFGTFVWQQL